MFLDRLAGWWLDWRTDRAARKDPLFAEFNLHKFNADGKSMELVIATETVAILADQAATMLKENDAENFIQLDMMPRLDRMLPPVRVTVQWANGMSPAQKCAKLEGEVKQWRDAYTEAKAYEAQREEMFLAELAKTNAK